MTYTVRTVGTSYAVHFNGKKVYTTKSYTQLASYLRNEVQRRMDLGFTTRINAQGNLKSIEEDAYSYEI